MTNRKQILAAALAFDGISEQEIAEMITIPTDASKGDYCLPCFRLAKVLRKSPVQIAEEAAGRLTCLPPPFKKAEAVNGYLNFFVDTADCAKQVLTEIEQKGAAYGDSDEGKDKTVCIDYSSINIAKPFHIGHLCTTVIGGALYRIYKKLGYTPVGINHLGDWGTQFGKLIVAFKKWSNEEALREKGMTELTSIYVRFHTEAETDPTLEDQARAWFKKIEDGDAAYLDGSEYMRDIKVFSTSTGTNHRITDIIETQQYLKASELNEIGLDANYNMKRESINTSEAQLNDDALIPFVEDMLNMRKIGAEKVNAMFGTNITVELSDAWRHRRETVVADDDIRAGDQTDEEETSDPDPSDQEETDDAETSDQEENTDTEDEKKDGEDDENN